MAQVYIYSKDNEDYSTIGECGALRPMSGLFEGIGNGLPEITLRHPLDALGRYRFIENGAVLKVKIPVRTTPEIDGGRFVTNVEQWSVIQNPTKAQCSVYSKKKGGKRLKRLAAGDIVTIVQKPADAERWKIKHGKTSGWMDPDALQSRTDITLPDSPAGIEAAAPAWESKEQLFRIYKVTKTDTEISCSARHISYDLLHNMTSYSQSGEVTLQDALDGVLANCRAEHEFTAKTDITGTKTGVHFTDVDPIAALLDPESGLVNRWNGQLIHDNFELFILGAAGMNRGMTIEYGKNMLGVQMDEDMDSVATAILPVGETKDGKPLYLEGEQLIRSSLAANYPNERIYRLECTDCKVGTDGVTTSIARARMREQAQALLDGGADKPNISVRVTFAQLGNSERYAKFRNLENAYLFDEITARHRELGIDITTQVIRIIWDFLNDEMVSTELGSLQALTPSVARWQLPGGISGSKIAAGSLGSAQMADDIVAARHIQAQSINTEKLQAESVTAEKIKSGVVETLSLDAVTAKIGSLSASDITTDKLAAALAAFTVVTAGTANFDRATVAHLVAQALNLEFGTANQVFIRNLAVQYAQMVGATIGELCIKASDGNYYLMDVKPDGTVTATKTTVTEGEISAGQTDGGRVILETNITAANLNAGNLLATYALINRIDAARIDVDQLFAREAFIAMLRTTKIVGDKSVMIIAQEAAASNANFRQNTMPTGEDFVRIGDIWVNPDTGITYQAADASAYNLRFALDENGDLYYELEGAPDDYRFEVRGYDLYSNGIYISIREDGSLGVPYVWMRVQDREVLDTIGDLEDRVDGKTAIYYQNTEPASPEERDLWYKDDGKIYRYSGGEWVDVTTTTLKAALDAAAGAQQTIDDYVSEMGSVIEEINGNIAELQKQIDGSINTWFYEGVPTLNNLPASEWTTNAIKDEHLGDLYYDTLTSLCYRFQKSGSAYSWVVVADSDVSKALEIASKAQDTADSKRRIFVERPAPPYDVGDLWVQGTGGDIMRCQTAKPDGSAYAASDWVKASKYTDDTAAKKAQATADGKIITFAQASAPAAAAVGDLWIDTDNDNMLYRWNGSKWMPYRDQLIVRVQEQADFATVYDSATPPAAPIKTGKLWLDRSVSPVVLRRWLGGSVAPTDMSGWEIVNDPATINEAIKQLGESALSKEEFNHYVKAGTDGLYVGLLDADGSEGYSHGYTRITYSSFDVVDGKGKVTASLGDERQDLGSLTIYTTADGHTAFVPREV